MQAPEPVLELAQRTVTLCPLWMLLSNVLQLQYVCPKPQVVRCAFRVGARPPKLHPWGGRLTLPQGTVAPLCAVCVKTSRLLHFQYLCPKPQVTRCVFLRLAYPPRVHAFIPLPGLPHRTCVFTGACGAWATDCSMVDPVLASLADDGYSWVCG